MSRRSIERDRLLNELDCDVGIERDLKRISKDLWKIKAARRERKRKK